MTPATIRARHPTKSRGKRRCQLEGEPTGSVALRPVGAAARQRSPTPAIAATIERGEDRDLGRGEVAGVGEGLAGDEQRHGEADAGERPGAGELAPGVGVGLRREPDPDRDRRGGDDADGLPEHEAGDDRQHQLLASGDHRGRDRHAGVGQREERQHQIARPRPRPAQQPVGRRLEPVVDRVERAQRRQRRPAVQRLAAPPRLGVQDRGRLRHQRLEVGRRPCRDEEREEHPRERRVQPALVDEEPERDAEERIGGQPVDPPVVQEHEAGDDGRGRRERADVQRVGIEQRDHDDRADVVDDRRRGQEDAELDRHPGPEHHEERHREGGVGRHRHAPAVRPGPRGDQPGVDQRRRGHAAERRRDRQRRGARAGEMADGELALDLEADDQEEDRQEPVVDPVQERQPKIGAADDEPELCVPDSLEAGPERRVAERHREERRDQQQQARRRRPGGEVEGGGADPVAEGAEHRVGERALVPGAVVAPAVHVEGRGDQHAARLRAPLVRLDPGARRRRIVARRWILAELGRDHPEVVLGQRRRAGHQRLVRAPERRVVLRGLDELGGAAGDVAAGQRLVAEDVAQPVAELGASLDDVLVGGAAVGTGVAAVLDQRDLGLGRPEDVVPSRIDLSDPAGSCRRPASAPSSQAGGA